MVVICLPLLLHQTHSIPEINPMKLFYLLLMFALSQNITVNCQTIHLTLINIKKGPGQLCIAVFDSEFGFRKEQPIWEYFIPKAREHEDSLDIKISLPVGRYGISVLDDANGDGQMNYRFPGIPAEGFGFSNYYHRGLKRPKWEQFMFETRSDQNAKVLIEMQYF